MRRGRPVSRHSPDGSLAGVAAGCGYYDQAHMANEWRAIAGMSLTEWFAQALRDPPLDTVAI